MYQNFLLGRSIKALKNAKTQRLQSELKLLRALEHWEITHTRNFFVGWKNYIETRQLSLLSHFAQLRMIFRWISATLGVNLHSLSPSIYGHSGVYLLSINSIGRELVLGNWKQSNQRRLLKSMSLLDSLTIRVVFDDWKTVVKRITQFRLKADSNKLSRKFISWRVCFFQRIFDK